MGMKSGANIGLAGALFSRVRLRVLSLLIAQPDRQFHAAEIIRLVGSGSGAVQRELKRLSESGILAATMFGNRKVYRSNRESPIFAELHGLIVKTVGLIEPLRLALKPHRSAIEVAFVYGSVAKGKDTATSDIDLMIIGNRLAYNEIYAALHRAEKALLRQVNPNLMSRTEWARKLADKSPFVTNVLREPKLFVFGTDNDLKGIG